MKARTVIPGFLLVIGVALALLTVAYAESLQKNPEQKPHVEGDAGRTGSLVVELSAQDREWPEGEAGRSGRVSLEGVDPQEWLANTADGDLPILYVFSGVTDDGEQGSTNRKEATSIHCTNIGLENTQVEIQLYQWNGTDVFTGTANLLPNRTVTFSTQNTTIYYEDVFLGGTSGTAAIFQGSGRILSSHTWVICTAQVLDPLNYPPVFLSAIELFRE